MPARVFLGVVLACACFISASGAGLRFTVIDFDTSKPVPCRIHLKDSAGKPVRPAGLPFWFDHFVCAGVAELDLVPGAYRYEIERGPEYPQVTGHCQLPNPARNQ